jgi:hypothetical protein
MVGHTMTRVSARASRRRASRSGAGLQLSLSQWTWSAAELQQSLRQTRVTYFGVVVVVGLAEEPAPDVVVVALGATVVVVVDEEGDVSVVGRLIVVGVVVLAEDGLVVVVVVVVLGVLVPPLLPPPKKVCPEPDWPRTTAERGFCATSSIIVSVTMAITSAAMVAPRTGTRILRQFRRWGAGLGSRVPPFWGPRLARPARALDSGLCPRAGG